MSLPEPEQNTPPEKAPCAQTEAGASVRPPDTSENGKEGEDVDRITRLGRVLVSMDLAIARVEAVLAGLVFTAMVVLVALPPVFRKLNYEGEYSWMLKAPPCLLLWVAFLGASIATRARRHVVIDVVSEI